QRFQGWTNPSRERGAGFGKPGKRWSERQDLNLRRLGPKPSALARLSYAPNAEGPSIPQAPANANSFYVPFILLIGQHLRAQTHHLIAENLLIIFAGN